MIKHPYIHDKWTIKILLIMKISIKIILKLHINIKINNKFSLQYRISRWTNDNDWWTNDNDWWTFNSAADKSPIRMIEKICCEIDS